MNSITSSTSKHKRIQMSVMESDSPTNEESTFYRKDRVVDEQWHSKKGKKKKKPKKSQQLEITKFMPPKPVGSAIKLAGTGNQLVNNAWNKPLLNAASAQPGVCYNDADTYPVPARPQDRLDSLDRLVTNKDLSKDIHAQQYDNSRSIDTKDQAEETKQDHSRVNFRNTTCKLPIALSSAESQPSVEYSYADVYQDIKDIGAQQSDNYQSIHTKDQSHDPCHSREHSTGRDKSPYGHSRERSDDHQERKRDYSRDSSKGLRHGEHSHERCTTNTQIESVPGNTSDMSRHNTRKDTPTADHEQGARPKTGGDPKWNVVEQCSQYKGHQSRRSHGLDNRDWREGGRGRGSIFDRNYGKDEHSEPFETQGKCSQPRDQRLQVQEPGRKKAAKSTKVELSAIIYKSGFEVHTHYGDLFKLSDENSFAIGISADIKMGAGIAVTFRKIFGGVEDLKGQDKTVGQVAILKRQERYIYYLILKERYNKKPNYNTLRSCLVEMKKHCGDHGVENLAMPKIGCGLDRLSWPIVEWHICEVFGDVKIKITVCHI